MKKLLPLFLLVSATPALAHGGHAADASFMAGLMHPLTGLDHVLAMIATGALASAFGGLRRWAIPAGFLAAMAAGFLLSLSGIALPAVEAMVLLSVVVLAALSVLPARFVPALMITLGFAIFHGHAHGTEAGTANSLTFGLGFLASSAGLITLGLLASGTIRARLPGAATARH